jgi:DNA repair protein RadC
MKSRDSVWRSQNFAMFFVNIGQKGKLMSIKEWPEDERPREKLLRQGAEVLSDAELLAIFLRTGVSGLSAVDLSRQLLGQFGSLRALLGADQRTFCAAHGLGPAKYVQLQAVLEMGKRHLAEQLQRGDALTSPHLTRSYLQAQLRDRPREVFALLLLDNQHRVIQFVELFFGTIDSATVWPREIVQIALKHNAAAVILAHNHPSGVAEPSRADRQITDRITAALALIDIRVLDHMVIGDGITVSFAERGWL